MGINVIDGFDVYTILPALSIDTTIELHALGIISQFEVCVLDEIYGADIIEQEICALNIFCDAEYIAVGVGANSRDDTDMEWSSSYC